MTNHTESKINRDLVTEAVELLEEVADLVRRSGLSDDPAFHAYHACQLEGQDRGWMGGPFLIDVLRTAAEEVDECPDCGGWNGCGPTPEDDYDECDCEVVA